MADGTRPTRMAIAQEFLMHVGRPPVDRDMELLAPHVTYRVPGNHALAGVFSGREAIVGHLGALFDRTGGSLDTVKWEDWMVGEQHVAALADVHIQVQGKRYKSRHVFLVAFDSDDKIVEIVVFFEDEHSAERFIGR
jgi:ketosteroid isomerase-like protein